jgi:hypothetical protein
MAGCNGGAGRVSYQAENALSGKLWEGCAMKKLMIAAAFAVAALSGAQVQAATYIRLPSGTVMPKHDCSTSPCVDCTFLDYKTCHEQADKLGLIDKNVGLGPGQRPPLYLGRSSRRALPGRKLQYQSLHFLSNH